MPNEGYRERLEKWEQTQRRMKEQQEADKPYDPRKMKGRMPIGCVIGAFGFAAIVAYILYRMAMYGKFF